MRRHEADVVEWKNRRAYRLSNGRVELTVLVGGGHIADFRLCGSPINLLWEAPWLTIEPQGFSPHEHAALYGDVPVGKFLSGFTGHALALGYFGMPSSAQAAQGLPLHGEAAGSEWRIAAIEGSECNDCYVALALEVELPVSRLHFRREIVLRPDALVVSITEVVTNRSNHEVEFQWVEHATFGEPLFTKGEASLFLSGTRGLTWPLGYEDHELLLNASEYQWPHAPTVGGGQTDLSQPFVRHGTGFVAAVLADRDRENAFVAVHNRRHGLVAGYSYDPARFPWIALWEENRARGYAPWHGKTRARGVEFGTSPMPLGLDQARVTRSLFDTPVLTSIGGKSRIKTHYQLFLSPVPPEWKQIKDVRPSGHGLVLSSDGDDEIIIE
ncbi:MAG TPA: DUF4432 family protein [Terriglobales bacterium]|jgi:hypothetical protein|nr:DUF4432 family protein [Terriglobales bacterium]